MIGITAMTHIITDGMVVTTLIIVTDGMGIITTVTTHDIIMDTLTIIHIIPIIIQNIVDIMRVVHIRKPIVVVMCQHQVVEKLLLQEPQVFRNQ
jgi:hypothetical protein